MSSDIQKTGTRFDVVCKRCKNRFTVIRNWGGGIRESANENNNPAKCPQCNSRQLEVY